MCEVVEDWARAIDPQENPAPPGALLELCEPGEHIHAGFHRLHQPLASFRDTASGRSMFVRFATGRVR